MTDISVPDMSESHMRGLALQLGCDFAADADEAICIADMFLDYIENGSGGVRVTLQSIDLIEFLTKPAKEL